MTQLSIDSVGLTSRQIGAAGGLSPSDRRMWRGRARRARDEVREAHSAGVLPHARWWADGPPTPRELPAGPVQVMGELGAVDAVMMGVEVQTGGAAVEVDRAGATGDEDVRFGPFGPTAQALRQRALGEEAAGEVDAAVVAARQACLDPGADPSAALVAAVAPFAQHGAGGLLLFDGRLTGLATWAARVFSAITTKHTEGSVRTPRGWAPVAAELGDEAALQRLAGPWGPGLSLVLVGPGSSRRVVESVQTVLVGRGAPHLVVRVPARGAAPMLGAAWVLLEAALGVAVATGVSPLRMPVAERYREVLESGGRPAR